MANKSGGEIYSHNVANVVIYVAPDNVLSDRKVAICAWLKQKGGRPIIECAYWFPRNAPSYDEFEVIFAPVLPGEGYVSFGGRDTGLPMVVSGCPGKMDDKKIRVASPDNNGGNGC